MAWQINHTSLLTLPCFIPYLVIHRLIIISSQWHRTAKADLRQICELLLLYISDVFVSKISAVIHYTPGIPTCTVIPCVWTQSNKRSALHNFKKHVDFSSQIHHILTLFSFAGMSVRLQSVAICTATAIWPVGVRAGLAAYPIYCTFIMICTQRKSHLWQIRYAQTWPKYIKPA